MAVRAAVRAHVTAAQALQAEPGAAGSLRAEARAYFDLARSLLEPSDPTLLAIGGFSGSGKSTVAALVAPHLGQAPGARTLNTDRIRKHIHGVQAETRLPPAAYVRSVSERVYRILRQEAADVLRSGYSVVADAVFDRPDQRQAIHQVGNDAAAAFQGVWLEAPVDALLPRIAARRNDPSDATAEVLLAQMQRDCGEITWRRVDASGGPGETRSAILALLKTARRWKRDPSL
jgi:predicted kinase